MEQTPVTLWWPMAHDAGAGHLLGVVISKGPIPGHETWYAVTVTAGSSLCVAVPTTIADRIELGQLVFTVIDREELPIGKQYVPRAKWLFIYVPTPWRVL